MIDPLKVASISWRESGGNKISEECDYFDTHIEAALEMIPKKNQKIK